CSCTFIFFLFGTLCQLPVFVIFVCTLCRNDSDRICSVFIMLAVMLISMRIFAVMLPVLMFAVMLIIIHIACKRFRCFFTYDISLIVISILISRKHFFTACAACYQFGDMIQSIISYIRYNLIWPDRFYHTVQRIILIFRNCALPVCDPDQIIIQVILVSNLCSIRISHFLQVTAFTVCIGYRLSGTVFGFRNPAQCIILICGCSDGIRHGDSLPCCIISIQNIVICFLAFCCLVGFLDQLIQFIIIVADLLSRRCRIFC